jgi:hypothetical protein
LRIRAALEIEQGLIVNTKLVKKIMRQLGIRGLPGPRKGIKNLTLAKLDQACGHGITWRLSGGGLKLTGGAIRTGRAPQGAVRVLPVSVGTTIYLEVGPGAI